MAHGVYHRTRKSHGMQYCPKCLEDDEDPYLRAQWRFALQFGCARHGIALRDACPHCDAPLMPHRRPDGDARKCSECWKNLSALPDPLTEPEREVCRAASALYRDGSMHVGSERATFRDAILAVRRLFSWVTSARLPEGFANEFDIPSPMPSTEREPFDTLETARIGVRRWAIPFCFALLRTWPDDFLKACDEFGVSRTRVMDLRRTGAPSWFDSAIARLPHFPRARRTRHPPRRPTLETYKSAFERVSFEDYFSTLRHVPPGCGE
ncbi:TniQ family protein [Panacagrimonas perspica]|uniref:TniQ family protein n=1 Tax=Panacagrimonas perspica TaxID=381431 RepID=UPI001FE411BA|nr:TniQ family protein [Panacagrimonas perspica]